MSLIELLVVSVGLSMDAFAVSVCKGLALNRAGVKHCLLAGLYFGLFQALMPYIGFVLGESFSDEISSVDHWIAFFLLSAIGLKMLLDARRGDDSLDDSFGFRAMVPLAIATSIDALAIGVGFAFLRIPILTAVLLIGSITCLMSAVGVKIGSVFGSRFRRSAERTGGIILILIGIKILSGHLHT